jgi:electron transport complex protein RnfD
MKQQDPRLVVQTGPFLRQGLTTPRLMMDVVYALIPVTLAALWFFGVSALLVVVTSIAGAVATEYVFSPQKERGVSLSDNTAVLTGLLLGLTLPPGLPLWMAFLGGVAGIGLGKIIWGGLGQNMFNPALVGRAFIQAAFPTAITTWSAQGGPAEFFHIRMSNFAVPLMQAQVDAVSTATPLNLMKFEQQVTPLASLALGNIAGSLGETSGLLILIGGAYLWLRRSFDWRIPVSILVAAAALSTALWASDPSLYPSPWFTLFSGSLLFGAVYMATDPVTSPLAPKGAWIFGFGVGVLVVLIRVFGGLSEGVMYAILFMNAATPLIERWTQPRVFGREGASK